MIPCKIYLITYYIELRRAPRGREQESGSRMSRRQSLGHRSCEHGNCLMLPVLFLVEDGGIADGFRRGVQEKHRFNSSAPHLKRHTRPAFRYTFQRRAQDEIHTCDEECSCIGGHFLLARAWVRFPVSHPQPYHITHQKCRALL